MRVKFISSLIIVSMFAITAAAQKKNVYKGFPSLVWPKLYNISYVKTSDDLGEFEKPIFSNEAKSLNGKVISLPGYIVPFDNGMHSMHFMFSSMPLNACFFCGVGGPETVVEVFSKSKVDFTEKPVEIKDILKLNGSGQEHMIYILEKAEIVGPVEF